MKKKPAPEELKERVLLIQKSDKGELRATLPKGARVTFGPTIPYKNKGGYDRTEGYSLRVYADKTQDSLLAVFCDVVSFRDVSMPVQKLVLREAGKALWKSDEEGYKVEQEVKVQRTFEDEVRKIELHKEHF